jgi:hypothetical protein
VAGRANAQASRIRELRQYPIELNRRGSVRWDEIARHFKGCAALFVQMESPLAIHQPVESARFL